MTTEVKPVVILYDYLLKIGMSENTAAYVNLLMLLIGILLVAWLLDHIMWKILNTLSTGMARRTSTKFDNFLVDNRVPGYVAHLVPFCFYSNRFLLLLTALTTEA